MHIPTRQIISICAGLTLIAAAALAAAPQTDEPQEIIRTEIVYKTIGDVELRLHVLEAAGRDKSKAQPAIVFFFGGGWTGGTPSQFFPYSAYLATRGMTAISAEYRIKSKHGATPFECVADGKSAIRYVRAHAKSLGVDPDRIAAGGGSAGGHVAACTGVIQELDDPTEDAKISSVPNALILFNPVADTTKLGYGSNRFAGRETEISPAHHVRKGLPPTLIMHGMEDTTVPYENVKRFTRLMHEAGNECKLVGYGEKKHGFFNYTRDLESYAKTLRETHDFLAAHGYLEGKESVDAHLKQLEERPELAGKKTAKEK